MKFKQILCGITAAAALCSFTAASASAEDTASVKKLLTVNYSSFGDAKSMVYWGDGFFMYDAIPDNDRNDFELVHVDKDNWRETGEFAFNKLESDVDLTGFGWVIADLTATGGNLIFQSGNTKYLTKADKENNTLTKVGTYDCSTAYALSGGYIFTCDTSKDNGIYYTLTSPDGKEFAGSLEHLGSDINFPRDDQNKIEGKYRFYGSCYTGNSAFDDGYEGRDYEVYGFKTDGTYDTIYSVKTAEGMWYRTAYSNAYSWLDQVRPFGARGHIYSADEDKLYDLDIIFGAEPCGNSDVKSVPFERICSKLYGQKAACYFSMYSNDELKAEAYALITVDGGDGNAKTLSKSYKYMGTHDGEIYLVQTADDKWGYIDSNGNELAVFDDAGDFIGDYAPVVSNGKGCLIDRNMNRVSEYITATGTQAVDDGLYRFTTDSDFLLVTYSNETASAPETSEPTSSDTSSEPSDTNSSAPSDNNPSSGIAISALPIIAAISAVIVIKSKK